MFLALTVVTGVAYPLVVTLVAQGLFSHQANGSLIKRDGKVVGSSLIGQQFDDAKYFWGRPSATGPTLYNAAASTGSNYGPTNPAQLDAVRGRVEALKKTHPGEGTAVPVDLVTASGSGLDPEISPSAAQFQVQRVASARGLTPEAVGNLVTKHTSRRTFGFIGEPRVNVLELNLALDEMKAQSK
jgi:K+-transporting ATPase ATPase C chain